MSDKIIAILIAVIIIGSVIVIAPYIGNKHFMDTVPQLSPDPHVTYMPHFVRFTVYPPNSGERIAISSKEGGRIYTDTDENSQATFKMISSIKYNISIEHCKNYFQIYPMDSDYGLWCSV